MKMLGVAKLNWKISSNKLVSRKHTSKLLSWPSSNTSKISETQRRRPNMRYGGGRRSGLMKESYIKSITWQGNTPMRRGNRRSLSRERSLNLCTNHLSIMFTSLQTATSFSKFVNRMMNLISMTMPATSSNKRKGRESQVKSIIQSPNGVPWSTKKHQ